MKFKDIFANFTIFQEKVLTPLTNTFTFYGSAFFTLLDDTTDCIFRHEDIFNFIYNQLSFRDIAYDTEAEYILYLRNSYLSELNTLYITSLYLYSNQTNLLSDKINRGEINTRLSNVASSPGGVNAGEYKFTTNDIAQFKNIEDGVVNSQDFISNINKLILNYYEIGLLEFTVNISKDNLQNIYNGNAIL